MKIKRFSVVINVKKMIKMVKLVFVLFQQIKGKFILAHLDAKLADVKDAQRRI